ncbi:hydroxyisourate hydrolase [Antrihabitans spumae]|jgi:5-hydroxyisourate hydrolase|uniref:5-hydroxyisourate hydrolase n=1 Tax=Antrihabitans spumae TaxID=3373370 RepID=A0ABW7KDE6_9NOCA
MRGTLGTHVLDAATGSPAAGVPVVLQAQDGSQLASAQTDSDGRIVELYARLEVGIYRLTFDTGRYFASTGTKGFYPEISITFDVMDADRHHHVPVLLSPYAYSTYLGS